MPHDLPPWSTVYDYYRRWVKTGLRPKINAHLAKPIRRGEGRDEEPSNRYNRQVLEALIGIEKVLADGAYQGEIGDRLEAAHQCVLEIVPKLGSGFVVAPWRWIVERTLSWAR